MTELEINQLCVTLRVLCQEFKCIVQFCFGCIHTVLSEKTLRMSLSKIFIYTYHKKSP